MIDESKVSEVLKTFLGDEQNQISSLSDTVHLCCLDIMAQLLSPESENDGRIIHLAAVKSYRRYILQKSAGKENITSIHAGDLIVQKENDALENVALLFQDAYLSALPLLRDNSFVFSGV